MTATRNAAENPHIFAENQNNEGAPVQNSCARTFAASSASENSIKRMRNTRTHQRMLNIRTHQRMRSIHTHQRACVLARKD